MSVRTTDKKTTMFGAVPALVECASSNGEVKQLDDRF